MTKRLIAICGWLAAGHAAVAGLFLMLLQVPESNVLMLSLSALVGLLVVTGAAWVETVAVLAWQPGWRWHRMARRGLSALPVFLAALLLFGAIWWITGRGFVWSGVYRTELDAWLMANWNMTSSAWLHATIGWFLRTIRYALGISLAGTLLGAGAVGGWGAVVTMRWLRAALAPRQWLAIGLALLVFVWLPWQAVDWRPRSLPATWIEPVFVATKLAALYLAANLGWALTLGAVSPRPAAAGAAAAASRPKVVS